MKFRRIGQVQIGKHVARTTCNGRARVVVFHCHVSAHGTKEIENANRIFHIDILPALRAK